MPKMTGTELAKVIKSEWPDIPVLLATGYADIGQTKSATQTREALSAARPRCCNPADKPAAPKAGSGCATPYTTTHCKIARSGTITAFENRG